MNTYFLIGLGATIVIITAIIAYRYLQPRGPIGNRLRAYLSARGAPPEASRRSVRFLDDVQIVDDKSRLIPLAGYEDSRGYKYFPARDVTTDVYTDSYILYTFANGDTRVGKVYVGAPFVGGFIEVMNAAGEVTGFKEVKEPGWLMW